MTSHSIAQLRISSGIFLISSGSWLARMVLSTFGNGELYSDQLNHCSSASPFLSGKYSFPTVSLYPNGDKCAGKNSHHSWSSLIFSIIFGTIFSYSSCVYCLFKIQYCLLRSHTQPNKFLQVLTQ